jgi:quinol monooxygenase YgiN
MFAIITTVSVEPGSIDELAALFESTNRDLVAGHDDWRGAWFTANRETNEVIVIAQWTDASSYSALRESPEFAAIMGQFSQRFVSPPRVTINEILVQM